jgi:GNAT superfamily N-acetyltransferase
VQKSNNVQLVPLAGETALPYKTCTKVRLIAGSADMNWVECEATMARQLSPVPGIALRPATAGDLKFALGLYLESVKPLLTELGRWDEARSTASLRDGFKPSKACVIRLDRKDIGWMQVSRTAGGLHLHQLHIVADRRNQGIGTCVIKALQDKARADGKPFTLNVIRGNAALDLYHRLGFEVVGEDEEKLAMRWYQRRSGKG